MMGHLKLLLLRDLSVCVCDCVCVSCILAGTQSEVSCLVAIINPHDAVNVSNGFTYKSQLTPVITQVSPRRGGTAGGTQLTITGSGFRYSKGRKHFTQLRDAQRAWITDQE